MSDTPTTPAGIVRAAARRLDQIADDMTDEQAAERTNGAIAADYGHGAPRADWTHAVNAARTVLAETEVTA